MCHLSMKFSNKFDQNQPCNFMKLGKNPFRLKTPELESKGQGHSKKQKTMP